MARKMLKELHLNMGVVATGRNGVRVRGLVVTQRDADIWIDEEAGVIGIGQDCRSMHSPGIDHWVLAGAEALEARIQAGKSKAAK